LKHEQFKLLRPPSAELEIVGIGGSEEPQI
jgi:hypothetical protein